MVFLDFFDRWSTLGAYTLFAVKSVPELSFDLEDSGVSEVILTKPCPICAAEFPTLKLFVGL